MSNAFDSYVRFPSNPRNNRDECLQTTRSLLHLRPSSYFVDERAMHKKGQENKGDERELLYCRISSTLEREPPLSKKAQKNSYNSTEKESFSRRLSLGDSPQSGGKKNENNASTQKELINPSYPRPLKSKLCKFFLNGSCSFGEKCNFAHGEAERLHGLFLLQQNKQKDGRQQNACRHFLSGFCPFGGSCHFSHTEVRVQRQRLLDDTPKVLARKVAEADPAIKSTSTSAANEREGQLLKDTFKTGRAKRIESENDSAPLQSSSVATTTLTEPRTKKIKLNSLTSGETNVQSKLRQGHGHNQERQETPLENKPAVREKGKNHPVTIFTSKNDDQRHFQGQYEETVKLNGCNPAVEIPSLSQLATSVSTNGTGFGGTGNASHLDKSKNASTASRATSTTITENGIPTSESKIKTTSVLNDSKKESHRGKKEERALVCKNNLFPHTDQDDLRGKKEEILAQGPVSTTADLRICIESSGSSNDCFSGSVMPNDIVIVTELFGFPENRTYYHQLFEEEHRQQSCRGYDSSYMMMLSSQQRRSSKSYQRIVERMCKFFLLDFDSAVSCLEWYGDGKIIKKEEIGMDGNSCKLLMPRGKNQNAADSRSEFIKDWDIAVCASFGEVTEMAFLHGAAAAAAATAAGNPEDCKDYWRSTAHIPTVTTSSTARVRLPVKNNSAICYGRCVDSEWVQKEVSLHKPAGTSNFHSSSSSLSPSSSSSSRELKKSVQVTVWGRLISKK